MIITEICDMKKRERQSSS